MILLVGGTSETAPLARALLDSGHRVLVSLATETELELPEDPVLTVRRGRLDKSGFKELIQRHSIDRVVDASHPFAGILRRELTEVCSALGIERIRFERSVFDPGPGVDVLENHEAAARSATSRGKPVLLTTGSRYLRPYVDEARRRGVELYARVLPGAQSQQTCLAAGLRDERIEFARGPFTVAQNREILRRWGIGVLVAKNGGVASGLAERMEAARREGVPVLLVRRPDPESGAANGVEELCRRIAVDSRSSGSPRSTP